MPGNIVNVHGTSRDLGIEVSNLKTTHEIAGNYPQLLPQIPQTFRTYLQIPEGQGVDKFRFSRLGVATLGNVTL